MGITIREISGKKALKKYVQFKIDLYKGNPYAVPPLIFDEVGTLNPEQNPAFEFCESVYYMAYDENNKVVGRIAGIINHRVNEKTGKKCARFGFVDFIDDTKVSEALFEAVEKWAREKGMEEIIGPLGFTDMDPEGMLVEGYDQLGTMVAIYNYPYYVDHVTRLGYEKDNDWVEFKIYVPKEIPQKHQRISDIVQAKYKLKIIKYKSISKIVKDYGHKIFELINQAYANLYGYSELSQKQIDYYVKMYIPMVRLENLSMIVNEQEELIGVGIAIPSMSKALQKANGKLFPFGFFHILKALRGKNDVVDLLLVAVRPDYQNTGANALLFSDLIPIFIKNGYKYAESNPELEENGKVQSQWQYFENIQHKRRRAYKKQL